MLLSLALISCSKSSTPIYVPIPVTPKPTPVPVVRVVPCYNSVPPSDWKWFYKEKKANIDVSKLIFVSCKGTETGFVYFVSYGAGWVGTAGNSPVATDDFLGQF